MCFCLAAVFRIRYRLLLVNALIVAVPLVGVGFARFYEGEMLDAVEGDMIHQGQLLREALVADPAGVGLAARGPMLGRAARHTVTRIRLLDRSAAVAADSAGNASHGEVLDRSEVRAALAGRYGSATRVVEARGVSMMFSALPIDEDGAITGVVYVSRSTAPVQAAMRRLRRSIFKILGLALIATAVLTLFLAATISRPLRRLADNARRIAAGDRSAALALDRRDEIGDLARALDDMAVELDGRAAEVAELAANVNHELKSPLTSMRGAAELLLDGAAADAESRERFLRNIMADVDRLDRMVSRLLELSRARGDSEPWTLIDLRDVVREAAASPPGDCPVELSPGDRRVVVRGRRSQLSSAVRNLVENAAAHARDGTAVAVSISERRGRISLSVANLGDPIEADQAAKIWARFYTTRASDGGTGLGLPIVAEVARAHGGAAYLVSSGPELTEFAIDLPAVRVRSSRWEEDCAEERSNARSPRSIDSTPKTRARSPSTATRLRSSSSTAAG